MRSAASLITSTDRRAADVLHAVKRRDPTPRWRCRAHGCNCVTDLFLWRPPVPASYRWLPLRWWVAFRRLAARDP
eukprot:5070036-Prymnesium_polylepis.1